MKIAVLGAGAWGTALAVVASRQAGHDTVLWARDPVQAQDLAGARENIRYLPGVTLPERLAISCGDLADAVRAADLVIVATPVAGLRHVLSRLSGTTAPVAWLCKGFEPRTGGDDEGCLPHQVCMAVSPELCAGVLSGPSFAQEVARDKPAALVAGSVHASVREVLVAAFHGPALRIYASDDMVGIEVGGAVKNVMAIAAGLCDGLELGFNARAALITRGLVEMTRLGVAMGARADTFCGLSGLGDLVLTATGDLSRNRKVGLLLAQGLDQQRAVASLGHVAEGVHCARTVVDKARALKIDMPIAESVVALLDGRLHPAAAVAALMERGPVAELGRQ